MKIQRNSRYGGLALVGLLAAAITFSSFGINKIRFGGEMHRVNQQLNDFNADILPPPAYLVEAYLIANLVAREPAKAQDHARQLSALKADWQKRADHWAASDLDDNLKQGLSDTVRRDGAAFWQLVDKRLLPAARRGDTAAAEQALDALDSVYERHRTSIDELVSGAASRQTQLKDEAETTLTIIFVMLALAVLMVFAGIAAALAMLRRTVIAPLATTADTMQRMAGGDLEAGRRSQHSDNEIGTMTRAIEAFRQSALDAQQADVERKRVVAVLRERLTAMAAGNLDQPIEAFFAEDYKGIRMDFNQAQAALHELILSVVTSAQEIHHSAGDVNDAAADLSERAARQAATLEETAAALQRTNKGIQSSSDLAQQTNTEVALARQNATRNRQIVETAGEAMAQIRASFAEVENITNIIQNIAFQTNILALNAGVEATRAGEAGKGFGVVATEVRALAQRSSEAVTAIQELMAKSADCIANGAQQVGLSGTALRDMIEIIDRVGQRVEQLAETSRVQALNIDEVDNALSSLERDTQQNAAMAEQSSAASDLLKQEVSRLTDRTALFTQQEQHDARHARSAPVEWRRAG
jgi:methyl-accepting chemotaxis protein